MRREKTPVACLTLLNIVLESSSVDACPELAPEVDTCRTLPPPFCVLRLFLCVSHYRAEFGNLREFEGVAAVTAT